MKLTKYQKITALILLIVTVGLIGYDIFIVIKEPDATISNVIMGTIWKFPFLIYAWIVLAGHFMSLIRTKKVYLKPLITISVCVLLFSLLTVFNVIIVTGIMLMIIGIIGYVIGMLCWGQRRKI